jgi:hypothetical protein
MRQTIIGSAIAVDPALVQDASYRFGPDDRRYIDEQIRGCEQHLVDSLLTGTVCTWQDVDTASTAIAIGDAVVATTAGKVSKATSVLLAAAGSAYGVAVTAGAVGGKVRVAIGGRLASTVTGLAAAAAGFARVNTTTARLERVGSYSPTDWPVGIIADDGTLAIDLPLAQGGGVAGTGRIGFSSVVYVDKAGDDTTGARGDIGKPFLTIAAAMAVAQSGDVVRVGPGTWAERVIFPSLGSLSLVGSGVDATLIDHSEESEPVVYVYPTSEIDSILIRDLTVKVSGPGNAIGIGGSAAKIWRVTIQDVRWRADDSSGASIESAYETHIAGCDGDAIGFGGCPKVFVSASSFEETSGAQWLDSNTTDWGSAFNGAIFSGCSLGAFRAYGSASVTLTGCAATAFTAAEHLDASTHGTATASGCNLGAVTISAIADTDRVATLDGCHMASLTVSRASGTDDVIVSAVNATCVAEPVIGAGCDVDMRWNTPDGGIAVAMKWSGSQDSRTGEVVQLAETWEIDGETVPGQITGLTLQGVTLANSTLGRVWVQIVNDISDNLINVYPDATCTSTIATGTDAGKAGGVVALTETLSSGVSGTITLVAGAVEDLTPHATLTADAVATFSGAPVGELGRPFAGIMYTNGASDGDSVWVVVAGKAKVLTYAGAAAGGYLYLDTERAYPDNGKVDCELPRTTAYEDHGIGRALERVTSGLVLAQLDLRGFGPVLPA